MQTFLPYPDFKMSAQCLDNKRLGKQRVEVLQILKAISQLDLSKTNYADAYKYYGHGVAWANHPTVKMWYHHEHQLIEYGLEICREWQKRAFKDTCFQKIENMYEIFNYADNAPFLGNSNFHLSHQSNLLRKDFNHYSQYFKGVSNNLPYQWYNPETKEFYTINKV